MQTNVRFSNRPFGVKHFQTIRHYGVDVAHGLVLLLELGARALVWGFYSQEVPVRASILLNSHYRKSRLLTIAQLHVAKIGCRETYIALTRSTNFAPVASHVAGNKPRDHLTRDADGRRRLS